MGESEIGGIKIIINSKLKSSDLLEVSNFEGVEEELDFDININKFVESKFGICPNCGRYVKFSSLRGGYRWNFLPIHSGYCYNCSCNTPCPKCGHKTLNQFTKCCRTCDKKSKINTSIKPSIDIVVVYKNSSTLERDKLHYKGFKKCNICENIKPLSEFYKGGACKCKDCKVKENYNIKLDVLVHYNSGGEILKCNCCGESNVNFLTLDHINDDGCKKKLTYKYLKSHNYPNDPPLQVLCFNCNCGKAVNGGICPHKQLSEFQ